MQKRFFQPSSVTYSPDREKSAWYLRNEFDLTRDPEVLQFNFHVWLQRVLMLGFTAIWAVVLIGVFQFLRQPSASGIPSLIKFQAVLALVILLVFNLDKSMKNWGAIGNAFLKVAAVLNLLGVTALFSIFGQLTEKAATGALLSSGSAFREVIAGHPGSFSLLVVMGLGSIYCVWVAREFRRRFVNQMLLSEEGLREYRKTLFFKVPTWFLSVAILVWLFAVLVLKVETSEGTAQIVSCGKLMLRGLEFSGGNAYTLGGLGAIWLAIAAFSWWSVYRNAEHTAIKAGAFYRPTGKKILVLGAGVTGGITGAYLTLAGEQALLLDTNSEHVGKIRKEGLMISGKRGSMRVKVSAADSVAALKSLFSERFGGDPVLFDVVILAVKSAATRPALESIVSMLHPDAVVVSLQNSINDEEMASVVGKRRILHGVTFWGGTNVGPGQLEQSSIGHFEIGEVLNGDITHRTRLVKKILGNFGRTEISPHVIRDAWNKMILNGVMNTYGLIFGEKCAVLFREPEILRVVLATMSEEVQIANRAFGSLGVIKMIRMDDFAFDSNTSAEQINRNGVTLRIISAVSGDIRSSMLQDYERGIRSENDYLAGLFIRENERAAREKGREPLRVPFLKRAYEVAARIDARELAPAPENIRLFDDLIRELPDHWQKKENFAFGGLKPRISIWFFSSATKWIVRNY